MKEKVYFKQYINNGIRYGFYNSDELYSKCGLLIDVFEVYLDFNTGHYSYISHIVRIYPLYDDLINIVVNEYNKVRGLYNDYQAINSDLDEESIKLFNNVYKPS